MSNIGTKLWKNLMFGGFLLLNIINVFQDVSAENNIGCLFAEQLCVKHREWCYDDFAFGKCLRHDETDPEQLNREPLSVEESAVLKQMLQDLQGAGLGWEHPFTQCRMQSSLYSIRNQVEVDRSLCAPLAPEINPDILDPMNPLAFVRFSPPSHEFAEETYYPPLKKNIFEHPRRMEVYSPNEYELLQEEFMVPSDHSEIILEPEQQQIMSGIMEGTEKMENRVSDIKNRIELRRMLAEYEAAERHQKAYQNPMNAYEVENTEDEVPPQFFQREFKRTGSYFKEREDEMVNAEKLRELLEEITQEENLIPEETSFREVAMAKHIPEVDHLANNLNTNFFNDNIKHHRFQKMYEYEDNELPSANIPVRDQVVSYRDDGQPAETGVYTEGGLVYVPPDKAEATSLLQNLMGFTRHERLDVKKPGPLPPQPPSDQPIPPKVSNPKNLEVLPEHLRSDVPAKKKKVAAEKAEDEEVPYSVDTEYAHVILKNPIDNWRDGSRIVQALGEMLNLQNYFTHPRVDRHEVSFRVEQNPEKKTASDVAKSINDSRFKNNLSRRLGVLVSRAGVGDKIKDSDLNAILSTKMEKADEGPDMTHVMIYMFGGATVAAILVISVTLFVVKRHDKKKDKLGGLQTGSAAETCSKDYQDLCRSRMQSKNNDPATGRIASLSKENDRPPSSRSSTSSWSEEPALTNMDISTGHMVLSYMEDHLRNKGRLQREWEALCRYEAEPNAREAAQQPECTALNRIGAPLPFDHSRVVLNHLAHAEGMDYINASTITDHDPRAPAYIAAQGPLPSTLAHFWQMVWEQGCVVLVALCRLQENGENSSARYWPEEGAETYHIYEVHLVSEHIWCDDYLVRSFYLKNLRTGETRTVTQFHFLSWPQVGVPASAKALLEFRRKVNKSYRGRSCPIVVHSSNGAGRTGAYILLDLVLGRMNKGAREIDIAATLEHLRDQRAGLVETRQQFEFVLTAVAEEVHAILKALPQSTQGEKREIEKDKETTPKEQENQNAEKPADKPATEK